MSGQHIEVDDDRGRSRYVVSVDAVPAGYAEYRTEPGRVVFTHTHIGPEFEGRGVGGTLARKALDDVRRRGLRVTPLCPFISAYIGRHPEYVDLVDDVHRAQFVVRPDGSVS